MTSSHAATVPSRRRFLRRALLLGGPLLLLGGGLAAYLQGGRYIASDNAYVRADKLAITSEVAASVVEVAVHDNQPVAVGQVLCRLDDSAYRIALSEARARLDAALADLAALRATYRQRQAQIAEASELVAFAGREFARQQELAVGHAATAVELDRARHALEAARSHAAVLQQEAAATLAALGGSADQPDEQFAPVAAARARIAAAERDLAKTVLRAPLAGIVTNVSNVAVGRYLAAGQPAFSLVGTDRVWIEANLKETELTYVKPGDPVRVEIDTYPQHEWTARVATIGPATGAEFSVIPAQNAAGNWVKVVQRIPVRIELEHAAPTEPLRAGMSAQVTIDTGHRRELRDLARVGRRG
jgi:membrane fusion protein (multidrug efflux system)